MKPNPILHRRAFAALIPAMVLLAPPGIAQDITPLPPAQTATPPAPTATPPAQTTTPPAQTTTPLVAPTVTPPTQAVTPVAPTVTPPPVVRTVTPSAATTPSTTTQINEPATTRATRTTNHRARATSTKREIVRPRPAPVEAVPAPVAVTPAPAPVTPEPQAVPAQPPVEAAAPPPVADEAAPISTDTSAPASTPLWPWLLGGLLVVIAAIAGLMGLRRRSAAEPAHHEGPVLAETETPPTPITAAKPAQPIERETQFLRPAPVADAAPPVAAAPKAAAAPIAAAAAAAPIAAASDETAQVPTEDAELAKPAAEEVAALTAGDPPVADRPWLEFSMRPIRAGTNVDEALVEIELTVGNSGSVAAEDVRISTFMFADAPGTDDEMERQLIERGEGSGAPTVTIKPGEGTRLDATLALPRAGLDPNKEGFVPVVVANARYRLPDGSEGRTSASFAIGLHNEGGTEMAPIQTDRALMHEDVEARLYGTPDRV